MVHFLAPTPAITNTMAPHPTEAQKSACPTESVKPILPNMETELGQATNHASSSAVTTAHEVQIEMTDVLAQKQQHRHLEHASAHANEAVQLDTLQFPIQIVKASFSWRRGAAEEALTTVWLKV